MNQPDAQHYPHGGAPPDTPPATPVATPAFAPVATPAFAPVATPAVTSAAIGRLAAIGGVGFAVASLASDLAIGPFPRPDTPPSQLVAFYAAHHVQVQAGGILLAVSGVCLVLLGTAVWARIQQAAGHPLLAGLTVIATALAAATTLISAGTYGILGDIGSQSSVAPAALQAWHIMGSDGSLAGAAGTFLFLLAVAGAGLAARVLPRWLAWPALLLAVLQLVPDQVGFLASLVILPWAAAAGICLLLSCRPRPALSQTTYAPTRKEVRHA
jgi:hypothetical protein